MSTRRVKQATRTLKVLSSTFLNGVTTITVDQTHYLTTGDLVTVRTINNPIVFVDIPVTVTSATAFSIVTVNDCRITETAEVQINFYATGQTGGMPGITLANVSGAPAVLQSYVKGTGGATYTIEGSLDNVHWTLDGAGTITHLGVTDNTQAAIISPAWLWVRINITVIGAATKLYYNISS